jgi:hypothetical protein
MDRRSGIVRPGPGAFGRRGGCFRRSRGGGRNDRRGHSGGRNGRRRRNGCCGFGGLRKKVVRQKQPQQGHGNKRFQFSPPKLN